MSLPDAAIAHDARLRRISASSLMQARRLWAQLSSSGDFDAAWRILGPQLRVLLSVAQFGAARGAVDYVPVVAAELALSAQPVASPVPGAFSGSASDGRDIASLLYEPVIAVKVAVGSGAKLDEALQSGQSMMDRIFTTQIADADRDATQVATAVRPGIQGYIRMVSTPCCGRCAVLAGKFYRWNGAFDRHPHCMCGAVPCDEAMSDDMRTDPVALVKAGQVRGLSEADTKAIVEDGADPSQVINAQRGTYRAAGGIKATMSGTSRRALAGQRLRAATGRRKVVRLRPQAIYDLAGDDRQLAVKLLRQNGYVL